jgi:hypothetical protein
VIGALVIISFRHAPADGFSSSLVVTLTAIAMIVLAGPAEGDLHQGESRDHSGT